MKARIVLIGSILLGCFSAVWADTHYVNINSATAAVPYTNWATAATSIQDAVDVAIAGDTVLVAAGAYTQGGRVVATVSNRIVVTNAITVRSASGPDATFIVGAQGSGTFWDGAVRCAYLINGAQLVGFTLTNGCTLHVTGDWENKESGGGVWGSNGTVSNCVIVGCAAGMYGGGVYLGSVLNCRVEGNTAFYGGGTYGSTVRRCWIARNSAGQGGGTREGVIENSMILGNTATYGGGTRDGTIRNCTIVGNSAVEGGASYGTATIDNSIAYYNSATFWGPNFHDRPSYGTQTYRNSCTFPTPSGSGNITNEPLIVGIDGPYLTARSPCINSGSNAYAGAGADIEGDARIVGGIVDMGCDEFTASSVTGSLAVAITATYTSVVLGITTPFEAVIQGKAVGFVWDWGDGSLSTNCFRTVYTYMTTGRYDVVLIASNVDVTAYATVSVDVVAGYINYVALDGAHVPPFLNWTEAATNIQDAIDVAPAGGTVMVGEGVYDQGMREYGLSIWHATPHRVAIWKPLTVIASNSSPEKTQIRGTGPMGTNAVRCVYVASGSTAVSTFASTFVCSQSGATRP